MYDGKVQNESAKKFSLLQKSYKTFTRISTHFLNITGLFVSTMLKNESLHENLKYSIFTNFVLIADTLKPRINGIKRVQMSVR